MISVYLSSTSLKALASDPHVRAPGQNTSETRVLKLGSTDPYCWDLVIQGTSGKCGTFLCLMLLEGLIKHFQFVKIHDCHLRFLLCDSAHSSPRDRNGASGTPHIYVSSAAFFFPWVTVKENLPLLCHLPFLSTPFPAPITLSNYCCCELD